MSDEQTVNAPETVEDLDPEIMEQMDNETATDGPAQEAETPEE